MTMVYTPRIIQSVRVGTSRQASTPNSVHEMVMLMLNEVRTCREGGGGSSALTVQGMGCTHRIARDEPGEYPSRTHRAVIGDLWLQAMLVGCR